MDHPSVETRGDITPVGAMIMWCTYIQPPEGFLTCNGADLSRTEYWELFALIGTIWGIGDGVTTFNIPDMRGIFPKGAAVTDRVLGKDASGNFYGATLGTYYQDILQGHKHNIIKSTGNVGTGVRPTPIAAQEEVYESTTGPVDDGSNGPPRAGHTTEPQCAAVHFIIRVKLDLIRPTSTLRFGA